MSWKDFRDRLSHTDNYCDLNFFANTVAMAERELDLTEQQLARLVRKKIRTLRRWKKAQPVHPKPGVQQHFLQTLANQIEEISGVPVPVVGDFNKVVARDPDIFYRYIESRGLPILYANQKWSYLPSQYVGGQDEDMKDLPYYEPPLEDRYLTETQLDELEEWIPPKKETPVTNEEHEYFFAHQTAHKAAVKRFGEIVVRMPTVETFLLNLEVGQFLFSLSDLDIARIVEKYSKTIVAWKEGKFAPSNEQMCKVLSLFAGRAGVTMPLEVLEICFARAS